MSGARLAGIAIVILVMVPATWMLLTQLSSGEQIQIDFTLKIESPAGDLSYKGKYHWGATEIDSSMTTSNVKWVDRTAQADVLSSGDLTTAMKNIFSVVSIETDCFSANRQGYWSLSLEKKLCDGIRLLLDVEGDNTSITHMTPSLQVSFVPSSLSSALQGIGLDSANVVVSISVRIPRAVVETFLRNCYEIVMGYVDLAGNIVDRFVGTIQVT